MLFPGTVREALTVYGAVFGCALDDLQVRPWEASDDQGVDRYGLRRLIGFDDSNPDSP